MILTEDTPELKKIKIFFSDFQLERDIYFLIPCVHAFWLDEAAHKFGFCHNSSLSKVSVEKFWKHAEHDIFTFLYRNNDKDQIIECNNPRKIIKTSNNGMTAAVLSFDHVSSSNLVSTHSQFSEKTFDELLLKIVDSI